MKAVASVIMNRVNVPDGEYARVSQGGNIRNILFQEGQFDCARETIRNQTRIAGKPSVSIPITLTIINDDRIETFLDGRVTNGTPSLGYGNQKLLDQTFTLKFSQVVSN